MIEERRYIKRNDNREGIKRYEKEKIGNRFRFNR